jgi:hypothetical protein
MVCTFSAVTVPLSPKPPHPPPPAAHALPTLSPPPRPSCHRSPSSLTWVPWVSPSSAFPSQFSCHPLSRRGQHPASLLLPSPCCCIQGSWLPCPPNSSVPLFAMPSAPSLPDTSCTLSLFTHDLCLPYLLNLASPAASFVC